VIDLNGLLARVTRARRAAYLAASLLASVILAGPATSSANPHEIRAAAAAPALLDGPVVPYLPCRTHNVGDIALTVSNYGILGSRAGYSGRLFPPGPPPLEFPRGSGVNYLFHGALWVGAVRGHDTLVSVGTDGWFLVEEMWPAPGPEGDIQTRTTRDVLFGDSLCLEVYFSPDAVSEQDLKSVFTDTVTDASFVEPDPVDGPHVPLGIRVTQTSYAWSFGYARDYILVDLRLANVSDEALEQTYIGLYLDQDVGHSAVSESSLDDLSGFVSTVPSPLGHGLVDTLNLAWTTDNDGDPQGGFYTSHSATGITGVRVLRTPQDHLQTSFNWWVSDGTAARDWGPNRTTSLVQFPGANLGTRVGDRTKYQMMSNNEADYDQAYSAIDHQADGWLPRPGNAVFAEDIADGFDTRYLLSFGPFDLPPGAVLPLTFAVVAGAGAHTDSRNFTLFYEPWNPAPYMARLDFNDFVRNARWAGLVFDNPGVDTDHDGYAGEYLIVAGDTIFYRGDGVPDYAGPPPPPAPVLHAAVVDDSTVAIRFNGQRSETARDPFSLLRDFEGYRVYLSTTGRSPSDFQLLASRDRIDFERLVWKLSDSAWAVLDPPFTLDSLKLLYDSLSVATYGFPFDPDSFAVADRERALREVGLDSIDPGKLDTTYYFFRPIDANQSPDDTALSFLADSLGQKVFGVLRKVFPFARPEDTLWRSNGTPFAPYYEYEYAATGLGGVHLAFLAVTPLDFGYPPMAVEPQASAISENVVTAILHEVIGDVDGDGEVDVDDILKLVFYLYGRGMPPEPSLAAADIDCNGEVGIVDVVMLVNYVFRGAPAPDCAHE